MRQRAKTISVNNVGTDPEFFLQDQNNGEIVSAIDLVPGNKENPVQIPEQREGNTVQTDNIMVELTVPPSNSPILMHSYVHECLAYVKSIISENLEVVALASVEVDPAILDHPQALEFGCSPDFNAWADGLPNKSPEPNQLLRVAGAHVHLELSSPDIYSSIAIIKAMDIALGVTSVLLDPDKRRKEMYGKAGAFRLKPYGVEYRVLSNFWVMSLEGHKYIFKGIKKAEELYNSGMIDRLSDEDMLEIQLCINTGNEKIATELVEKYDLSGVLNTFGVFID